MYTLQIFYPDAGAFMSTNHVSESIEALVKVSQNEAFAGFKMQIVDATFTVVGEIPARPRHSEISFSDLATVYGVPLMTLDDAMKFAEDNPPPDL